jgi:hypothetical protein
MKANFKKEIQMKYFIPVSCILLLLNLYPQSMAQVKSTKNYQIVPSSDSGCYIIDSEGHVFYANHSDYLELKYIGSTDASYSAYMTVMNDELKRMADSLKLIEVQKKKDELLVNSVLKVPISFGKLTPDSTNINNTIDFILSFNAKSLENNKKFGIQAITEYYPNIDTVKFKSVFNIH